MAAITDEELKVLHGKACDAKRTAYAPYSNFAVGCCILTESGEYIMGCNVENAAYPIGICAEKNAIGTAVAAGQRRFKALVVSTNVSPPAAPCGGCRQFIREFVGPNFPVYMFDKDGECKIMTMEQLLPSGFGPDDLHSSVALN